jgi:hypothetical protein
MSHISPTDGGDNWFVIDNFEGPFGASADGPPVPAPATVLLLGTGLVAIREKLHR